MHNPPRDLVPRASAASPAASTARAGRTDPAPSPPPPRPLSLRFDDGREVRLAGRIRIGSARDNDLVVDDRQVSAHHCTLAESDGRVTVEDHGSRNGTWLGGVRVSSGELRAGVRLTVGATELVVTQADAHADDLFIGRGPAMRRLRGQIARVAPTRVPVLLLGESGTGKELAARALHARSGRRGLFVAVNCGAISAALAESELFGHEKGAFTGAAGRRRGLFEEADGGTLFLDEIGDLPLPLQAKLLRALETSSVRAVGAQSERAVDVRIVAATHHDLPRAVRDGGFRLDLYHRLEAVTLRLPSLRERAEDIPLLAEHFLVAEAAQHGPRRLTPEAMAALVRHPWPGNVRELRNAIVRAVLFGAVELHPDDLLPQRSVDETAGPEPGSGERERRRRTAYDRSSIEDALRRSRGNRRAAAQALGVPKSTLCDRVRRYGIAVGDEPDPLPAVADATPYRR